MRIRLASLGVFGFGVNFCLVDAGGAATRYVPSEYPTIQAGVDASAFGDTVLVAPGTYSDYEIRDLGTANPWSACVFLADGIVVKSESGAEATVIDMDSFPGPQPSVIIARDLASSDTVLEGFTITGAPLGGRGIYTFISSITVRGCVIRDIDVGVSNGGGMIAQGNHRVIDCEFINCRSNTNGGALYHANGHLDLIGCTIRECASPAVRLNGIGGGPVESATIANCEFVDNVSTVGAGAISCGQYFGGVSVTNCFFRNNVCYGTGGGALDFGQGNRLVENCVFIENGALAGNGRGGAFSMLGIGTCVVRGNTFFRNYKTPNSSAGAAVAFLCDAQFDNNIVAESAGGGAVYKSVNFPLSTSCNVFWANPGGIGIPLSSTDREVDPQFCDPALEDLTLRLGSPCLPEDPLGCGLIGVLGMGCGSVSVQSKSWGLIKGAYRTSKE